MKTNAQIAVDGIEENHLKFKVNFLQWLLKIIDYLIIVYKLCGLIGYVFIYKSALDDIAQKQAFRYLIPFIIYSIIGIIRMLKYQKLSLSLLLVEVIFNIYFIINVAQWHAYYLIMTIISLAIILKLFYHMSITRKDKMII